MVKKIYEPKLLSVLRHNKYDKKTLMSDVIAGIIVGIIALPLAIAFGIASGVTPQQGLITAIVAGFIIAAFGGTRYLIGGPTGAFIVIVAGIVNQYGMQGLIISTIMAGIMLVVMGVCRMGVIFKFIPYPIIVGFTSGIAVTIFSTQMKDFFGINAAIPSAFIPEWIAYFQHIADINWVEAAASTVCLLLIIGWGFISKKIPGSLIALVVGTIASVLLDKFAGIHLATIGTKFPELAGGMPLPSPVAPTIDMDTVRNLVSPAITIALLGAIESLLAAMVTDGVTGKHHDANSELIGEGVANIITPLFGGIPATGAIARTMANINNGGRTPIAGIIHAITLLLIFLFLMPYAIYIPLSALAAILVMVAYNMSEWRTFKYLLHGNKDDVTVLLITFFLTIIIDLKVAIEVGVVLAIVLFTRRVMQSSDVTVIEADEILSSESEEVINPDDTEHLDIPAGVTVYEVNGPFFFGLANKFEEFEQRSKEVSKVHIIRMRRVPFMDSTGVNNLRNLIRRNQLRGTKVILSGVNPNVQSTLHKFGLDKVLSEGCIQPHISLALEKAREILKA